MAPLRVDCLLESDGGCLRRQGLHIPKAGGEDSGLVVPNRRIPDSAISDQRQARVHLLRWPSLRHRPPSLRPHSRRHHQGHRHALPLHDRPPRHPPLRLGLPRPPRRERDRQEARHQEARGRPQARNRQVQRGVPRHRHALRLRVGDRHHSYRKVDRLQERLQNHGPQLHGVRLVGFRAAIREKTCL